MKVAYLCHWNLAAADGVARKIEGQVAIWREAGHDALVVATRPGFRRADTRAALDTLASFRPNLVYVRYDIFLPPVWRALRRLTSVVEVNTDDRVEVRSRRALARVYNAPNRRSLFGGADGVVCVTHELARRFREPVEVIANGADPASVPELRAPSAARPRAVFSGSPDMAWHGVDRLLELAAALPEVDFDLVGPQVESPGPTSPSEGGSTAMPTGRCSAGRMSLSAASRWSAPACARAAR